MGKEDDFVQQVFGVDLARYPAKAPTTSALGGTPPDAGQAAPGGGGENAGPVTKGPSHPSASPQGFSATELLHSTDRLSTTRAAAEVIAQGDAADSWIRDYLHTNQLRPDILGDGSGRNVMFNNRTTPIATAISTTVAAGRLARLPHNGAAMITIDRVQRIFVEILAAATPHAPGPSGSPGPVRPNQVSMYLQYTFTPTTVHTPMAGGPETSDQPAHSLTGQITAEFHAENQSGLEVSAVGQATWFADDAGGHITNQSGFTGVQVAWVWSFLEGALQAGPQFQALVGASRAQQGHSDRLEWTPTGQVGAGGQIQYAIPGLRGHVLVGIQGSISATAAQGGPSTVDRSVAFTLTYKF